VSGRARGRMECCIYGIRCTRSSSLVSLIRYFAPENVWKDCVRRGHRRGVSFFTSNEEDGTEADVQSTIDDTAFGLSLGEEKGWWKRCPSSCDWLNVH
jgi:hypothetical protein